MTNKKFFIETYGCQMNKSESAIIKNKLENSGYIYDENNFDIVIIYTCSVRKTAENRIWGRLGFYKNYKRSHKIDVIVVGCMSQRVGLDIISSNYDVDIVIGNYYKDKIIDIILSHQPGKKEAYIEENNYSFEKSSKDITNPNRAYVTISHGCNNFCTYCIVPYLRGREVSRSSRDIVDNIIGLTKEGVKEVILLGQNVNSYGNDTKDINFTQLLTMISKETDVKWIKFMSSHPKDFTDELSNEILENDKVSKHLHLALQSGSDAILKKMNRHYTAEDFYNKISKLRKRLPLINITTDIIVGFSNETIDDFNSTLDLVKSIEFDDAFMYKYNEIENTKAQLTFDDNIRDEEKVRRLTKLIDIQREISLKRKKLRFGSKVKIIPERYSKNSKDKILGTSDNNLTILFNNDNIDFNRVYNLRISGLSGTTLYGERLDE